MVSVRQVKAARALLGWSQDDLAKESGVSKPTVARLETTDGKLGGYPVTRNKIVRALDAAGVIFVEENGDGPGVRLRRMGRGTKEDDEAKRTTRKAFLAEERVQQSEQRVREEAQRQATNSAKTTKLRGLREARDATEREAAEAEAKRVARIKRKANPKRAKAAKALGVRLRKAK